MKHIIVPQCNISRIAGLSGVRCCCCCVLLPPYIELNCDCSSYLLYISIFSVCFVLDNKARIVYIYFTAAGSLSASCCINMEDMLRHVYKLENSSWWATNKINTELLQQILLLITLPFLLRLHTAWSLLLWKHSFILRRCFSDYKESSLELSLSKSGSWNCQRRHADHHLH